jgi:hypothetical protein
MSLPWERSWLNFPDMMIQGYYGARGWTTEGLIPDLKLHELEWDIVPERVTPSLSSSAMQITAWRYLKRSITRPKRQRCTWLSWYTPLL